MFFQHPKRLPDEYILDILNRLPIKEALTFLLVSREMNAFIKDDYIWKKFGADNFEDFVIRMKQLTENFRGYIIKNQYNYTLALAEDIIRIQNLPPDQQQQALFTQDQLNAMPAAYVDALLDTDKGIQAVREGLITAEQVAAMPNEFYLNDLLRDEECIQALRERLITPAQAAAMPTAEHLSALLLYHIQDLRNELITLEDVAGIAAGEDDTDYQKISRSIDNLISERELHPIKRLKK